MKKAEIQSKVIIYILSAIVAAIILIFAAKMITTIGEKQRTVSLIKFEKDFGSELPTDPGSVKRGEFELPANTKYVCFIDLNKTDELLESPIFEPYLDRYPDMKDSIESKALINVFAIKETVTASFYGGSICFDYPYFLCIETPRKILDVWFEGRAKCTTIRKATTYEYESGSGGGGGGGGSGGTRDETKYPSNGVFIAPDKTSTSEDNWRDIAKLVTISIQNDMGTLKKYPYLAYYDTSGFDNDDIIYALDRYDMDTAVVFAPLTSGSTTINGKTYNIESTSMDSYFDYWRGFNSVVLLGYDDKDAAVITSLFASYLNAPLIFVNEDNLPQLTDKINNKIIYIINKEKMDENVVQYAETNARNGEVIYYNEYDIRFDSQLNPFRELSSQIDIP